MRKIAVIIAMLLMPCLAFASLISNDSATPIKKE